MVVYMKETADMFNLWDNKLSYILRKKNALFYCETNSNCLLSKMFKWLNYWIMQGKLLKYWIMKGKLLNQTIELRHYPLKVKGIPEIEG